MSEAPITTEQMLAALKWAQGRVDFHIYDITCRHRRFGDDTIKEMSKAYVIHRRAFDALAKQVRATDA